MSTKALAIMLFALTALAACNDGASSNDPAATPPAATPVEPAAPAD